MNILLPPLPLTQVYPAAIQAGESVSVNLTLDGDWLIARYEVQTRVVDPERVPDNTLWDGNVVELFLSVTGDSRQPHWPYYEFEVSPYRQKCLVQVNGEGVANRDFDWNLRSFIHAVSAHPDRPGWDAEMHISLTELGWDGDPSRLWLNAFAILGPHEAERRFYGLNLPKQEKPNFHLPGYFVPLMSKI